MTFSVLMANAFGRPSADGVDDVGGAFNGTESIPQTVTEGLDDAPIGQQRVKPCVQRSTGRVGIAFGFVAVFEEGEGRAV